MISEATVQHVAELRAWLRTGLLAEVGPIDTDRYFFATAETAARVLLADLEHLAHLQRIRPVPPARWRAVEDDIETLHRAVTARRRAAPNIP